MMSVEGARDDLALQAGPPAPLPEATIEPMAERHLAGVVALHQANFPDETLTRLGRRAVLASYETYLTDPTCISFVATHGATVVASVNGKLGPGFVQRMVRRHPALVGCSAVMRVVREPRFLSDLARVLRRGENPWPGDPGQRFYWRMMVVAEDWRGRGIVVPLIQAMLEEARRRGARDVYSPARGDNLASVWVHRVFGFQSRPGPDGLLHWLLDLQSQESGRR